MASGFRCTRRIGACMATVQTSKGMFTGHQDGRDTWKDFSDSTGNTAEPAGLGLELGLGLMAVSTCFALAVSVSPSIAYTRYNNAHLQSQISAGRNGVVRNSRPLGATY